MTIILISSLTFLLFQARQHIIDGLTLAEARFALQAKMLGSALLPSEAAIAAGKPEMRVSRALEPFANQPVAAFRGKVEGAPKEVLQTLGFTRPVKATGGKFVIEQGRLFASIVDGRIAIMTSTPLTAMIEGVGVRMVPDIAIVIFLGILTLMIRESRLSDYSVRRLLDASPVPLFVIDASGKSQFANRAAYDLFCGGPTRLVDLDESLSDHAEILNWLVADADGSDQTETREFELADGRYLLMSRQQTMVRSRLIIIGSAADITVRHDAEHALTEARDAAEALGRMKTESLAMISHELKTPVSGVLGLAQVLSDQPLPASAKPIVHKMIQVGKTLAVIINDIVDLAVLETGHLRLEHVAFNPREIIETAVAIATPAASEKRLSVRVHVAPDLPDLLLGDSARLQQIVINLVGNGIKFTETGHVDIDARFVDHGDDVELWLRVTDTGVGIAAEVIPRLFQPFSQGDAGNRRRLGGTGLGLAISKRLAEAMHGGIWVESELDLGSTFRVRLQFAKADRAPVASHSPIDLTVLVVDDAALNLEIASQLLRARGSRVETAESGAEAMAILGTSAFDLVLMDIRMPDMDGLTATAAIRSDPGLSANAGIIIGLTANPLPTDRPLYALRGLDDVLAKPIDLGNLSRILAKQFGTSSEAVVVPERIASISDRLGIERAGRILEAFSEVAGEAAEAIAVGCSTLNFAEVREAAHRLIGAAANVGFEELSSYATGLEDAALSRSSADIAVLGTNVIRSAALARHTVGAWMNGQVTSQKDSRHHARS